MLTPKTLIDRDAAFVEICHIAQQACARWEADGKSEEEIGHLIEEAVNKVRGKRKANPSR